MTLLFDATLQLAQKLGVVRVSTTTGGSATTLVDTKRIEKDDTFKGGTTGLITEGGGAPAAPEGEYSRISAWDLDTWTATVATMTAIASGDTYAIAAARYPLDLLISAINNELIKHEIPRYDRTSLDIVTGQSEYTLPTGIRGENIISVYEETDTDSNDSKPVPLNFDVQEAATGSQHLLVIKSRKVTAGNDIMLEYMARLSPLYLATDVIDDIVPMALILPAAAAQCELIRMRTLDSGDPLDIAMLQFYRDEAQIAKRENIIRKPAKRGKVLEV